MFDEREYKENNLTSGAEDILRYRPGGFHPVALHDKFKDGRYEVVNKLGRGKSSTIWLAWDIE